MQNLRLVVMYWILKSLPKFLYLLMVHYTFYNLSFDENFKPRFIRYTTNNWSNYFSFSEKTLTFKTSTGQNTIFFVSVNCISISNGVIIISTTTDSNILLSDHLDSYHLEKPWVSGSTLTFTTDIVSFRSGFRME